VSEKRIFVVPTRQWDSAMQSSRLAVHLSLNDLGNLTGGIIFGMTPSVANSMLPDPLPGVSWNTLPAATEFPEDVRYFWTRLTGSPDLRAGIRSCTGANSFAVFLFRRQGLFRISFRLVPDATCPDPAPAAADIFARYVPLGSSVALATHYVTGGVQVVDVGDPTANYLIPIRWENRSR
jgi:hypothetical protein